MGKLQLMKKKRIHLEKKQGKVCQRVWREGRKEKEEGREREGGGRNTDILVCVGHLLGIPAHLVTGVLCVLLG